MWSIIRGLTLSINFKAVNAWGMNGWEPDGRRVEEEVVWKGSGRVSVK